ncbi:MAG: hypothetical protein ACXAC7_12320 [Candidatus Hodarchaeales archaeon]|jgi:hypothetical protein
MNNKKPLPSDEDCINAIKNQFNKAGYINTLHLPNKCVINIELSEHPDENKKIVVNFRVGALFGRFDMSKKMVKQISVSILSEHINHKIISSIKSEIIKKLERTKINLDKNVKNGFVINQYTLNLIYNDKDSRFKFDPVKPSYYFNDIEFIITNHMPDCEVWHETIKL